MASHVRANPGVLATLHACGGAGVEELSLLELRTTVWLLQEEEVDVLRVRKQVRGLVRGVLEGPLQQQVELEDRDGGV